MHKAIHHRPYVLSIAGFDPSNGAGIVADAKAMEACQVYGLTVCTAITVQHESVIEQVEWLEPALIKAQIKLLLGKYPVDFCKIGLIENWTLLLEITELLLAINPKIKIVVDPIFRASSGFNFHHNIQIEAIQKWLHNIYLLTPNAKELSRLNTGDQTLAAVAQNLAKNCAVLYKGGHNPTDFGVDFLYDNHKVTRLEPKRLAQYEKHGSGCVLSSVITANLALGHDLETACRIGKDFITDFLDSSPTLLGYH